MAYFIMAVIIIALSALVFYQRYLTRLALADGFFFASSIVHLEPEASLDQVYDYLCNVGYQVRSKKIDGNAIYDGIEDCHRQADGSYKIAFYKRNLSKRSGGGIINL